MCECSIEARGDLNVAAAAFICARDIFFWFLRGFMKLPAERCHPRGLDN